MEVIHLDPRNFKKASEVLAASFYNYPEFIFYFPDPERRTRNLSWYLGNVLRCALRYGEVYTTPEMSGLLFTLPPGHTRISMWEYIQNGFILSPFMLGFSQYKRSMESEDFLSTTHEKIMNGRPHTYLWGLAVDPNQKRAGIGTALLKPILEKAELEKMPIYLETHDEKNVAYYQRSGFELALATRLDKYDLPLWCMLREPA
jgi:ribosomal protein S18 acetylase RimI-like enzyme